MRDSWIPDFILLVLALFPLFLFQREWVAGVVTNWHTTSKGLSAAGWWYAVVRTSPCLVIPAPEQEVNATRREARRRAHGPDDRNQTHWQVAPALIRSRTLTEGLVTQHRFEEVEKSLRGLDRLRDFFTSRPLRYLREGDTCDPNRNFHLCPSS